MEIINLPFEIPLTIEINGKKIETNCFETIEHGNIKFGVSASRSVKVDREEVHQLKKQKEIDKKG